MPRACQNEPWAYRGKTFDMIKRLCFGARFIMISHTCAYIQQSVHVSIYSKKKDEKCIEKKVCP